MEPNKTCFLPGSKVICFLVLLVSLRVGILLRRRLFLYFKCFCSTGRVLGSHSNESDSAIRLTTAVRSSDG